VQREYTVADLPPGSLDAHAALMRDHVPAIRTVLDDQLTQALAVVLPPAGSDHTAARRALAGDLAREYAPRRVNLVAGLPGEALATALGYLRDAPGVTGQYIELHD
jgi:hypothetical protein